jgi:hypothetical protein
MKLTRAKFLIPTPPITQGVTLSTLPPSSTPRQDDAIGPDGLEFGPSEYSLGTLPDIYLRHLRCPFCRLAVQSLDQKVELLVRERKIDSREAFFELNVQCMVGWQLRRPHLSQR